MKKIKMLLMSALIMVGMISVPTLDAAIVEEAKLANIKVNGTVLSDFDADSDSYTLEVEPGNVTVTAEAVLDSGDRVAISVDDTTAAVDDHEVITAGKSLVYTITVTDGTDETKVSTYTLTVTGKTTTPPTPSEPTEEEKMNALINEVKEVIADTENLAGFVEVSGYHGKTIEFDYAAELEDGTIVSASTSVLVEDGFDAAKVVEKLTENLDSAYVQITPPESNMVTETALELMKLAQQNFYFYGNVNRYVGWVIDGSKITDEDKPFNISVLVGEEVEEKLRKSIESLLVDKTKGLVLDFAHDGKLPAGTKVEMEVSDKFKDGDVLSLFYYNPTTKKLEEKVKNIKVEEGGYVSFDLEHCSSYVLAKTTNNAATGTINVVLYSSILVIAIAGIVVLVKKKNN